MSFFQLMWSSFVFFILFVKKSRINNTSCLYIRLFENFSSTLSSTLNKNSTKLKKVYNFISNISVFLNHLIIV